jgi:hypothetical protein
MRVATLAFGSTDGWSAPFPLLDSERTLVTVFGAPEYVEKPGPLDELRRAYPLSAMIGCSTAGEILNGSIRDGSLAVAIARFEFTQLAHVATPLDGVGDSRRAGDKLGRGVAGPSLRGVFVLSDGLSVNGSELLRGMAEVLGDVPLSGGLAGDGHRFQRTWVLSNGAPAPSQVAAVAFYGDRVRLGHGCRGGWDIFGRERVITRSAGNVLYELDGRPALSLYKEYLGDRAAGLPATALLFPLAIRASSNVEPLVRTVLSVHEEDNSLTFAGDVPQGALAQLMSANLEHLIDGAGAAGRMPLMGRAHEGDSLTLAVSCVGRRLVLGERADEEVEAAAAALGDSALVGFYSYGEISPLASGRCELHNQTMTLTRIGED